MPYKDFREFLDFLDKKGELKTCHKEVDTEIEIAKITDKSSKVEGPAILFTNVKGFDTQVVTGLFGNLDRGFLMMDSNKYEAFNKVALALENMIPLNLLNDGPCQEIVKVKNDIDLNEIPTLWHHRKDSHRFITTANCRVKDPVTKICNSSINRVAVLGKDRLTFQSNPPHQLAFIAKQY
ncbi:MAG TPA: UbiD family decarboxylase, partial [Rhodospirillales bacterium]|nr:UbiD family decarboxylase [Rhodospirillales bacterium]